MTARREAPIGVFDSGLGGLSVVHSLTAKLPQEHIVYLGDTARVPYGTKSPEVVTRYAIAVATELLKHDVKILVVACNTASSVALPALSARLPIPVIGVIEPGAAAAARSTKSGVVAVIGTEGTIRSGAYQRALAALAPNGSVRVQACPLFVPLVEEGWYQGEVPTLAARRYLTKELLAPPCDTLVLGCTHYPLLRDVISDVAGTNLRLIDSGVATADYVATLLEAEGLSRTARTPAQLQLLTTDAPLRFQQVGAAFLGRPLPTVSLVDLSP